MVCLEGGDDVDDEYKDYNDMTMHTLKEQLRIRNLKLGGRKDELIERLEMYDAEVGNENDKDEGEEQEEHGDHLRVWGGRAQWRERGSEGAREGAARLPEHSDWEVVAVANGGHRHDAPDWAGAARSAAAGASASRAGHGRARQGCVYVAVRCGAGRKGEGRGQGHAPPHGAHDALEGSG